MGVTELVQKLRMMRYQKHKVCLELWIEAAVYGYCLQLWSRDHQHVVGQRSHGQ
jgi:hypothetical protein